MHTDLRGAAAGELGSAGEATAGSRGPRGSQALALEPRGPHTHSWCPGGRPGGQAVPMPKSQQPAHQPVWREVGGFIRQTFSVIFFC